jgi:DNA (cytosine-5)-methyltransferase 1
MGKGKEIIEKNKLNVLDLFCGAGGFSKGFKQAGYKILAGIDNDENMLKTFASNFRDSIAIKKDLSDDNFEGFESIMSSPVDVIIGGPPCQGFSIAGKRVKDDPRNVLYRAYLKLIKHFRPKSIVIENVPTILGLYRGEIAKQIIEDLEQLNYRMKIFKVMASDYGVPQNRKRIFFIGLPRKKVLNIQGSDTSQNADPSERAILDLPLFVGFPEGEGFNLPEGSYINNPITSQMAISDLPLLDGFLGEPKQSYSSEPLTEYQKEMRKKSPFIWNHEAVDHQQKTIDIIKMVPDGGNYKDLPKVLWKTRKVNIAWTRMNSRKPCFTIDAGHNHHFHYEANRVPTVRECARIQSFPDRFIFYGNRTSQYRQVGNAVPPIVAKMIGKSLKKAIDS